jgi:hypothetical protein
VPPWRVAKQLYFTFTVGKHSSKETKLLLLLLLLSQQQQTRNVQIPYNRSVTTILSPPTF